MRALAPSLLALGTLAGASTLSSSADAHIRLDAPTSRFAYSGSGQKTGPCGAGTPTNAVTTFNAGETITVEWVETIGHPGHYRIALDPNGGDDDLVDPSGYTDFYNTPNVLLDNIPDTSGTNVPYSVQVTLPNTNCDKCSLQLIQVMTDKPPWGDGNDLYYWCADIQIVGGEDPPPTTASSSATTGATTSATSGATTGSGAGGSGEGGSGEGGAGGSRSIEPLDDGCSVGAAGSRASGWALAWLAAAALAAGALRRRRG